MVESHVFVESAPPLVTLTLNHPERRNAIDRDILNGLSQALDQIRDNPELRAVIIKGAGGVFSSGIDHTLLVELFQKSQSVPFTHLHYDVQDVLNRIERMEKPVIAVLSRYCIGLGMEIALACDFCLATQDCVLGLPEIAFGIVPDVGGTTRLVRAVGAARARELILTGKIITARKANHWGLFHQLLPTEEIALQQASRLTQQLLQHPSLALGKAKILIQRAAEVDNRTSLQLEGIIQSTLLLQPDLLQHLPLALDFIRQQIKQPDDEI